MTGRKDPAGFELNRGTGIAFALLQIDTICFGYIGNDL